ncbi:MAG: ABC transporter ATP-binding protein [Negativicutes bacterium]
MAIIELKEISKTYQGNAQEVHALKKISLQIEAGEFVAVVGPSGCGKTTLMNVLGCLDQPTGGSYKLNSQETSGLSDDDLAEIRNRKIGFVFQSFNLLPRTTALENVMLPFLYSDGSVDTNRAEKLLHRVGLGERLRSWPNQLSGGQQQRVAIARALANDPALVLADEPTGQLDTTSSAEILDLLKELNREGATIVIVTHDLDVAAHARRVITLRDGSILTDEVQIGVQEGESA